MRDLEERARQIKSRMRPGSVTPNLSDSEAMRGRHRSPYDRSISRERGYPLYDRDPSRGRRKGNLYYMNYSCVHNLLNLNLHAFH